MVKRLLVAGLMWTLALPRGSIAQEPAVDPELAKGIRQAQTGDFENALVTLDAAAKRLSAEGRRPRDLARAYVYLSIAYLGLSQEQNAKAQFLEAWKLDKGIELSPKEFPPKARQFFEEARKEARAATQTETTPPNQAVTPKSRGLRVAHEHFASANCPGWLTYDSGWVEFSADDGKHSFAQVHVTHLKWDWNNVAGAGGGLGVRIKEREPGILPTNRKRYTFFFVLRSALDQEEYRGLLRVVGLLSYR